MYIYHLISIDLQSSRSLNSPTLHCYSNGYNIVIILVNCFSKRLFLIPYYKNINAKEVA